MPTIDDIAYASPFRDWSPLGKFLLALSLLVSSLVASTIAVPLIVFVVGLGLLFYSSRLRFPRVLTFALLEGLAIFLIGAVVISLVTTGETAWSLDLGLFVLNFTREGVELGVMVVLRALAGMTVMLFFATSTPIPQFAQALRQAKMPKELVELMVLVYRYSFLLLEQAETMYVAADCRLGFRGHSNKLKTTSKLAVGVFTRSVDMAERSQVALDSRCFRGEFHAYHLPARISSRWVAASVAAFGVLYAVNLAVQDPAWLTGMFVL